MSRRTVEAEARVEPVELHEYVGGRRLAKIPHVRVDRVVGACLRDAAQVGWHRRGVRGVDAGHHEDVRALPEGTAHRSGTSDAGEGAQEQVRQVELRART